MSNERTAQGTRRTEAMRPDLELLAGMTPRGSRVLDLGCGDGALLEHLIHERGCDGQGVEISSDGFHACIDRGVPVMRADIDDGLADFEDDSFDIVILAQTLQATRRPAFVLAEMFRIGRRAIVSFPNFGHWSARSRILFRGLMPVSRALPYKWYDTPNIHLCTIHDFEGLVGEVGLRPLRFVPLNPRGGEAGSIARRRPNMFASGAVYLLEPVDLEQRERRSESRVAAA